MPTSMSAKPKQVQSIRLSKENSASIADAVEGTLVSPNKAANQAIQFGMPELRRKLGKKPTQAK